ncbi:MAG: MBL fold metallo-hydrolase [Spirochaetota bacterium]|nr:MBL fold metallo-hydrolase [Spirochaetota bacterium]
MLKIGNYEIHSINTGSFRLDGGVFFGALEKPVWSKFIQPDSSNGIELAMRCLLLKGRNRNILVDCGIGTKLNATERLKYSPNTASQNIDISLHELGLTRADIHHVILTHLHFDHAGGATELNGSGDIIPSFPEATYHAQRKNLHHAQNPFDRDKNSYNPNDFQPLLRDRVLKLTAGSSELFPGVELIVCDGHTIGQQLVKVSDRHKTLIYCGDLIPTTHHLTPHHVTAYDLYPELSVAEKKKLLSKVSQKNWILFFQHDPVVRACAIQKSPTGYSVREIIPDL